MGPSCQSVVSSDIPLLEARSFYMKNKSPAKSAVVTSAAPSEQEISDYAFHLYQQGNCEHGHDLDHWQEASACLIAGTPRTTASV